jgi:hypothetical protein
MALVIPTIQKQMEKAIMAALISQFSKEGVADKSSHKKMAAAVAQGVCQVLIKALQTKAEVLPGISTAGSQSAQKSVTPGKIF